MAETLDTAESAFERGDWAGFDFLIKEMPRVKLSIIDEQSKLAAQQEQNGQDYPQELKEHIRDLLDTYRDLEDMVVELVQFAKVKDEEQMGELLAELREYEQDLRSDLEELDSMLTRFENSQFRPDDEFYLG